MLDREPAPVTEQERLERQSAITVAPAEAEAEGEDIPEDEAAIMPKQGMYFETEDDAYEFYRKYGEHVGFSVRKSKKWTNEQNIVVRRLFVCSKQGFRWKGDTSRKPRSPGSRTGCGACLCVKMNLCGTFGVAYFERKHNHPLARQPTVRMGPGLGTASPEHDPKIGPAVDMHFETQADAYSFYTKYAEHVGFSVRLFDFKRRKGVVVTRAFVCSCEGIAEKYKKSSSIFDSDSPPTRTGCQARMVIKMTECRTFRVTKFIPEHNHPLENPDNVHRLRSHKTDAKLLYLDLPEKRRKRKKGVLAGDVGATLEYLQGLQNDNPSLYYTVGLNGDGKATNFFWTDTKAVLDFGYFSDVLCFDTTYSLNNYNRPFALFVGVDNHRRMIVFGSALLYDYSSESLKWLFQAFADAMRGKLPGTVLTDEGEAVAHAVSSIWPDCAHRVSVWHLYHSARKQLKQLLENSMSNFMSMFAECLFQCEEEPSFISAWEKLVEMHSLGGNKWIGRLFREKESWALPYGRHMFSADIISTLRKENMVNLLRKELNKQDDVLQFLKRFENILDEHRSADTRSNLPIPTIRMLKQVGNTYTTAAFKMFQSEFEAYMNCMAYPCGSVGPLCEYKVTVDEKLGEHIVKYDSMDGSIVCSCKKFESVGIQCCHVLKVFDIKNIKELPMRYIMRRWTKEARSARVRHEPEQVPASDSNSKTLMEARYQNLCRIASMIAARAIKADETMGFIESQSNAIMRHLDHISLTGFREIASHVGPTSKSQHHNVPRGRR